MNIPILCVTLSIIIPTKQPIFNGECNFDSVITNFILFIRIGLYDRVVTIHHEFDVEGGSVVQLRRKVLPEENESQVFEMVVES